MKKIVFTPTFPVDVEYYPEPCSKNIPEWYKSTDSFIYEKKFNIVEGQGNQTIKKCIPVFDAMYAGYIIKSYVDVYVKQTDFFPHYYWPSYSPISFHDVKQADKHPKKSEYPYPKWMNPWSIKTDSGYSCLFISPMHQDNNIFTILPGIVDTDSYINPVNFPFTLNDPKFEGLIPAGTPIAQVIPFKRDSFEMKIGKEKDVNSVIKFSSVYSNKWVNNYKSKFWHKKQYR